MLEHDYFSLRPCDIKIPTECGLIYTASDLLFYIITIKQNKANYENKK